MGALNQITKSDYLPFSEYQRLLACLENEKKYTWCAYCVLSFSLALRISDILNLTWEDVIGQRSLTVTEKKTGKTKEIPISVSVSEKIQELYLKLNKPNIHTYICVSKKFKKVMSVQYINCKLKYFKRKYNLQIDHFSTHTFRKTFGRYIYDKFNRSEEALILLNQIFRHDSISTTKIYIGLRNDEVRSVFEKIVI